MVSAARIHRSRLRYPDSTPWQTAHSRAVSTLMKHELSRWLILGAFMLQYGCSAFVIRHVDATGQSRTYVSEKVFTGTGTLLDCVIGPLHWLAGLFYLQPYVQVRGSTVSYPTFGASGCFGRASSRGGGLWGTLTLGLPLVAGTTPAAQVDFVDINHREVSISGGSIEVTRATERLFLLGREK